MFGLFILLGVVVLVDNGVRLLGEVASYQLV